MKNILFTILTLPVKFVISLASALLQMASGNFSFLRRKTIAFLSLIVFIICLCGSVYFFWTKFQPYLNTLSTKTNGQNEATSSANQGTGTSETATVERIIDGDTIEIRDASGQLLKVRYIGINAPELANDHQAADCFAQEATLANKELVEGKTVRLEKDVSETDQYGRLLRYVYVGTIFVNEYLVRQGYAKAVSYPPDVHYYNLFWEAESEAQQFNRGLWTACENTSSEITAKDPVNGCTIKGNLSWSGEKIYHLPDCPSYDQTVINELGGEKWFCTEAEAQTAGWKKAPNCP